MASAVSPRSKLSIRYALGIMIERLRQFLKACCCVKPYSLKPGLSRQKAPARWDASTPLPVAAAAVTNSPLRRRAQRDVICAKIAFSDVALRGSDHPKQLQG